MPAFSYQLFKQSTPTASPKPTPTPEPTSLGLQLDEASEAARRGKLYQPIATETPPPDSNQDTPNDNLVKLGIVAFTEYKHLEALKLFKQALASGSYGKYQPEEIKKFITQTQTDIDNGVLKAEKKI